MWFCRKMALATRNTKCPQLYKSSLEVPTVVVSVTTISDIHKRGLPEKSYWHYSRDCIGYRRVPRRPSKSIAPPTDTQDRISPRRLVRAPSGYTTMLAALMIGDKLTICSGITSMGAGIDIEGKNVNGTVWILVLRGCKYISVGDTSF